MQSPLAISPCLLSPVPCPLPSPMPAITVYCASSNYLDPEFHDTARTVGTWLARKNCTLVYGGGSTGLMGELARAAREQGGEVVGIITRYLHDRELGYDGCRELITVDTMRERKRLLEERGEAFLILPGGLGTYEEMFEIIVGRLCREHDKPIGIVNAHGYYNPLIAMIEHGIEHRFIKREVHDLFTIDPEPEPVLAALLNELTTKDSARKKPIDRDKMMPMS